jgi:hypothetical protein
VNYGPRWLLDRQAAEKDVEDVLRAFDLDEHPATVVEDPARELQVVGQTIDVGAEPDPLNGAANLDSQSLAVSVGRQGDPFELERRPILVARASILGPA